MGYSNTKHLQLDNDFIPLRNKKKWLNIIKKIIKQEIVNKQNTIFDSDDISWLFDQDITGIYSRCSDSLKQNISKKELGKTIHYIRIFFKKHQITNAAELRKVTRGTSTNHISINNKKTKNYERRIVPDIVNGLPGVFFQKTGYKLIIAYLIKNNNYLLDKIEFIKPYFDKQYLINNHFLQEAIAEAHTINLYTYYNENKYNLKKDLWNNSFSKPVIAITKLPFVKNKKVQFTALDKPYYLILLADKRQHKTATIIFSDNNKYILISDGHKMGFVHDKKATVRKLLKPLF